jgi:hypothetical protein
MYYQASAAQRSARVNSPERARARVHFADGSIKVLEKFCRQKTWTKLADRNCRQKTWTKTGDKRLLEYR